MANPVKNHGNTFSSNVVQAIKDRDPSCLSYSSALLYLKASFLLHVAYKRKLLHLILYVIDL